MGTDWGILRVNTLAFLRTAATICEAPMPLSDAKIRSSKAGAKQYKLSDGQGLFLLVTTTGSRLWRYRFWLNNKEGVYAIGEYPYISLSDARERRDQARELVRKGQHPVHRRREEELLRDSLAQNTFESVAREWIQQKSKRWSEVRRKRVQRTLEKEVFPNIGALAIGDVSSARLLAMLQAIATRRGNPAPVTALLVQSLCGAVFRYAIVTLRAQSDPTYPLRGAISRPRIRHKAPLERSDISALVNALRSYGGSPVTVAALRLLLLTFVRPGELRRAQWNEFDLDGGVWRIPASAMKGREVHLVPLSKQAVTVLRDLKLSTGRGTHLFPNSRRPKSYMASTTLNRALENVGFKGKFSAHSFRATASTFLNELDFDENLIERQLDHKDRNTTRASYNQAKYLAQRANLMQEWANFLDKVVRDASKSKKMAIPTLGQPA